MSKREGRVALACTFALVMVLCACGPVSHPSHPLGPDVYLRSLNGSQRLIIQVDGALNTSLIGPDVIEVAVIGDWVAAKTRQSVGEEHPSRTQHWHLLNVKSKEVLSFDDFTDIQKELSVKHGLTLATSAVRPVTEFVSSW